MVQKDEQHVVAIQAEQDKIKQVNFDLMKLQDEIQKKV
jgi:hypothetical protein